MKLFLSLLLAASVLSHAAAQKQVSVTRVEGESWLHHLHRALDETSMGKTGRLGPPTLAPVAAREEGESVRPRSFKAGHSLNLQGADLYRLNCRECHGELGLGAPPEINPVIGPTLATYAPFTLARLNKLGMETSRAEAATLANQAKGALLERLHAGGVDMPPFPHLSGAEVRAIFGYLRQLAEIPGARTQQLTVEESPVRLGEHIVKATCHICHDAVGVNPGPDELMLGTIPPLSTLTARVNLQEFVRKVRHGAPIVMGSPLLPYRGRMPVFYYLSESEVADAYLYLKLYPPGAAADPVSMPEVTQAATNVDAIVPNHEPPKSPAQVEIPDRKELSVPLLAEILVILLVVGGAIFTVYEVKRLKVKGPLVVSGNDIGISVSGAGSSAAMRAPSQRKLSDVSQRMLKDANKQAAWHSQLDRSEYHLFETSWLSRRLENEEGAA